VPLHEYETDDGERIEHLCRAGEERPPFVVSSLGRRAHWVMPRIAHTPGRWGDTPGSGRRYDRGLCAWVDSDRHAAQVAASRGLVSVREIGDETDVRNYTERYSSARHTQVDAEGAEQAEFAVALKRHNGDAAAANAETWSAERILAGATVYAKGVTSA
jgi:hypothetical protein